MAETLDHEKIKDTEKPNRKIREILGAIVLSAALIFDTVFHEQDSDTVFDAGGKAAIIVLMLTFFVIYYIQIEKNDYEQK
ncbi:hypothetical protein FRZ06_02920 [Anoxybacterium hadale]|uniref:Uncharacterized protein n=1 Tax=Anoxybacterium hadale TaxID=3408580 RepID=A0ACD1A7L5_9FIRM|nr:hypothetical protein FRZ06_02920 [Clostridiales bacterium]